MPFDHSEHGFDQLLNHNIEKATRRAQLDSLDQQLTYHQQLSREQDATTKDLHSQLEAAEAENVGPRDGRDAHTSDEPLPRQTPLDLLGEADTAKARSRKRCRAPNIESVSD